MSTLLETLENMANEIVEREGFRLYDIEFQQTARKLVVTIDKDGGAVSIEDCVNVSRGLNLLLDVEDVIPGEAYDLEVSSPGLERVLKRLWHFQGAVGEKAKVSIKADADTSGFGNLRAFKAEVSAVSDDGDIEFVNIENSKLEKIVVPFESIHKAQLVFEYGRDVKKIKDAKKAKKAKN